MCFRTMKTFRNFGLTCFFILSCQSLFGQIIEADGISYNIIEGEELTVEVSSVNTVASEVVIPETIIYQEQTYKVKRIGTKAFDAREELVSVIFSDNLTEICEMAFINCPKLTNISISKNVNNIDYYSFLLCPSLTSITVDPDNDYYDSRENCNAIIRSDNNELIIGCKNTIIPSSVQKIGLASFYFCRDLESIFIPREIYLLHNIAF